MRQQKQLTEDIFGSFSTLYLNTDPKVRESNAPANMCSTESPEGFEQLTERGRNILLYFWRPSEGLKNKIATTKVSQLNSIDIVFSRNDVQSLPSSVKDTLSSEVLEELKPAIHAYTELLPDQQNFSLKFEKTHTQSCPLFHVDRVSLRLLCTLKGPGTEWVEDKYVNRHKLGKGRNDKIIKPKATICSLKTFQVGILKGSDYPGNFSTGIVHRSPAVAEDDVRWCLKIDVA